MLGTIIAVMCVLLMAGVALVYVHSASRFELPYESLTPHELTTVHFGVTPVAMDATPDEFVLDGTLIGETGALGPDGWPITVHLPRSDTASLDNWMGAYLSRWVAEDTVVDFAIHEDATRQRVSITDGSTTLHFVGARAEFEGA